MPVISKSVRKWKRLGLLCQEDARASCGDAAVRVASFALLPGIGVPTFKQSAGKTDRNAVFMPKGVLAIGTLGATSFAKWIWSHILPAQMPGSPMAALAIICFLVELLHIPSGSVATSQALAVPSLAEYAPISRLRALVSFVTFLTIVGQQFFPYQKAVLVVGMGSGLWKPKDIFKPGCVMFNSLHSRWAYCSVPGGFTWAGSNEAPWPGTGNFAHLRPLPIGQSNESTAMRTIVRITGAGGAILRVNLLQALGTGLEHTHVAQEHANVAE